jgi:4-deoxy-L-threo-5-hexosulose-uronate ketol-isomerase
MMKSADAAPVTLGAQETANKRTIYKFIHQGGIQSCQLVMGLTALEPGSVWNSFPPHTHWRRTEIYFYFDLGEKVLTHFFGEPQETRHLFLHNEDVALSPNWSMHFGVGTGNYKFIWGMAGENQVFEAAGFAVIIFNNQETKQRSQAKTLFLGSFVVSKSETRHS